MVPGLRKEFAVIFCADRNMFFPAVAVAAEAATVPGTDRYDVILFADKGSIPAEFAAWLRDQRADFQVVEVDFCAAVPANAITSPSLPAASFFRLYLTKYLERRYRRLLYIDSDTEIRGPVDQIFRIDMRTKAVAAADDLGLSPINSDGTLLTPSRDKIRMALALSPHQRYANSGVLLIDPEEWERQSLTEKTMSFAVSFPEKCRYADQDALNAILRGDYRVLSPRWNYSPALMRGHGFTGTIDPIIVHHYVGPKPWWADRWDGDPKSVERFRKFFGNSPWPAAPHSPDWLRPKVHAPRRYVTAKSAERYLQTLRKRLVQRLRAAIGKSSPPSHELIDAYLRETAFADAELTLEKVVP